MNLPFAHKIEMINKHCAILNYNQNAKGTKKKKSTKITYMGSCFEDLDVTKIAVKTDRDLDARFERYSFSFSKL